MSTINHQYKHTFVHVPKTAGSSMEQMPFVGGNSHLRAKVLALDTPDNYLFWGFVRNPADRLLSAYHAALLGKRWKQANNAGSFETFVMTLRDHWMHMPHTRPMTHYLCDDDGNVIVRFVGRFENLLADWAEVCRRLKVGNQQLKHKLKTNHPHWTKAYNMEMLKICYEVYRSDYDTFGYEPFKDFKDANS